MVCAQVAMRKREVDASWDPRKLLSPLAANDFLMYMPTEDMTPFAAEATSSSAAPPLPPPLAPEVQVCEPPVSGAVAASLDGSPYLPFAALCGAGFRQHKFKIPVNAKSRRVEKVLPCSTLTCNYYSKTAAEFNRHCRCHHPDTDHTEIENELEVDTQPAPMVTGYSLGDAEPIPAARTKKKRAWEQEAGEEVMQNVEELAEAPDSDKRFRARGPTAFGTENAEVIAALGQEGFDQLKEIGFSITWAQGANSWRGYYRGKYQTGSNAHMGKFGGDRDAAIRHVLGPSLKQCCQHIKTSTKFSKRNNPNQLP